MNGHTATIDEKNGIMLIFGGYPNRKGTVYALDLTDMTWRCINKIKYKRYRHTADRIGNSIYLFGGRYSADLKNDLQKYDIKL